MSVIYLLPCHGDTTVKITTAEAGRTVDCPCGKQVQVPTLREIRQLPRVQQSNTEIPTWSTQQGVLFSIGLVLLTGALGGIGWLIYQRMQLDTKEVVISEKYLEAWDAQIMSLDAEATLDGWNQYLNHPLPENRRPPKFEVDRDAARVIGWKMLVAGGVGFIGLCLMGSSAIRFRATS